MVGVFVQGRQVEVGIGGEEVEDELFLFAIPILPADVPAFDEEGVEAIGSGEVDITTHVGVVGAMGAVGFGVHVVSLAEDDGRIVVGVCPGALTRNHLPPNTHILDGVNPRHVLQSARLVEVEDETRSQGLGGRGGHHNGAPRRMARGLHAAFVTCGIGAEEGMKYHILVVKIEVHGRIVKRGGLVDVDV